MVVANLSGIIYTDFQKAVKVANAPTLLHKMGREGNLPLFQFLLMLLQRNPQIQLVHVKAHWDIKKCLNWTRPQWGKYYADLLAKNRSPPSLQIIWNGSYHLWRQ